MSIDIAVDDTGFRKLQMDVVTMTTFNGMRMWPISVEWCKLISN